MNRPLFHLILLTAIWLSVTPLWADYGNRFIVNSRLAFKIDRPDQKIAFRFTSRQDADVIGLSVFCQEAQNPPAYLISLQEDKNGIPSGIVLGESSVVPKPQSWATVPVENIPLIQGKVYDLVIQQDAMRGGFHPVGVIDSTHQASFGFTDFANKTDPQDGKPDPKLNVLLFQNSAWKVLNRQPLYAIHETGSALQGDPYDDPGSLPIHGNGTPGNTSDDVMGGEALHPHCAFTVSAIVARIRQQGHPTSPLNYRVYNIDYRRHKTSLAFEGQAVKAGQGPARFQWVTIPIHPQGFPPECRYIVFQTDSGQASNSAVGCDDCYLLAEAGNSEGLADASDLTFDGGAHLSRETFSNDGGADWLDAFERDADVYLVGPDCSSMISNAPPQTHPLNEPPSLFRILKP